MMASINGSFENKQLVINPLNVISPKLPFNSQFFFITLLYPANNFCFNTQMFDTARLINASALSCDSKYFKTVAHVKYLVHFVVDCL